MINQRTLKNTSIELSITGIGKLRYYDDGNCMYIRSIHVNQAYRNKGYGTILLNEVISRCTASHEAISLYVGYTNEVAICFYRKHGFFIAFHRDNHRKERHYLMVLRFPVIIV